MWAVLSLVATLSLCANAILGRGKPAVDPGLFMIMGVKTCRDGSGYCLLGLDCTLDDDFLPDDSGGHCNGLKNAFTPSAKFTCCKYNTDRDAITTTRRPRPGHIKTTSTTTDKDVTEDASSTSVETLTDLTTEKDMATNAVAVEYDNVDVFVDINNEVIKEVIPPTLDQEEAAEVLAVT